MQGAAKDVRTANMHAPRLAQLFSGFGYASLRKLGNDSFQLRMRPLEKREVAVDGIRQLRSTGIDLSKTMVSMARKNVPGATFQRMNMTAIDFPPESFDGVISCYAIIHIPREKHASIFQSFHSILKPRGIMLVSVASWAWEEVADYLGVDMFWSHYESSKTESLIRDAGFAIEFGRTIESGGETHHWVLARKD